jgi:hypothetical protein
MFSCFLPFSCISLYLFYLDFFSQFILPPLICSYSLRLRICSLPALFGLDNRAIPIVSNKKAARYTTSSKKIFYNS